LTRAGCAIATRPGRGLPRDCGRDAWPRHLGFTHTPSQPWRLPATEGDWLWPIYRLAVFTGMRRGEPLGLRWDDVDLEAATGRVVRRRLQVAGEMVETAGTKTRRGMRTVDVDEGTVAALRRWRLRRLEERLAAGEPWVESDLPGNRRAGCGRRGSRRCAASTCRRSGGTTSATHTRR
jgi:integrase